MSDWLLANVWAVLWAGWKKESFPLLAFFKIFMLQEHLAGTSWRNSRNWQSYETFQRLLRLRAKFHTSGCGRFSEGRMQNVSFAGRNSCRTGKNCVYVEGGFSGNTRNNSDNSFNAATWQCDPHCGERIVEISAFPTAVTFSVSILRNFLKIFTTIKIGPVCKIYEVECRTILASEGAQFEGCKREEGFI